MSKALYIAEPDLLFAIPNASNQDSRDRLSTMLNEADTHLQSISGTWEGLMSRLHEVERGIQQYEQLTRKLDAFVDDALYHGDAETARLCAERATLLRAELRRIAGCFNDNKMLANALDENLRALQRQLERNGS